MVLVSASPAPVQTPAPRDTFFDKPIIFGNDPEVAPSAKASAAPTPVARRRRAEVKFGLSGSASSGASVSNSTHQSANGQTSNTLGLQASIERRSDRSDLRLSLPASINTRGSYIGAANAEFVTSRGVFSYGFLSLTPFGSLPFSPIDRAYSFARPLGRGAELSLFSGSSIFEGSRAFDTTGMRYRRGFRRGIGSIEGFQARATDGNGFANVLLGGFASRPNRLTVASEFALEQLHSLGDVSDGGAFAYQMRGDYALPFADLTITKRFVTDRFIGLGGTGGRPESLTQAGLRTAVGRTQIDVQTTFDLLFATSLQSASNERRHGLTLSRPIGAFAVGLSLADDQNISETATTWSGNGSQSLGFTTRGFTVIESLQGTRSTSTGTTPSSSVTGGIDIFKPTRAATLQAQFSRTHQTGEGNSGLVDTAMVGASRTERRYLFGISDTLTRTTQLANVQTTNATTVSFGRKLFRDVLVQVQYGRQTVRSTSAHSNGTSSLLNFSVGAPFALGSAGTIGKPDPRAPATILGTVNDEAVDPQFASSLGGGVANLAVTLDGIETQHTDARGRFQFRFVTPGRHEVRIEPADLPRGYTVNYPFVTINVAGGQTAQIGMSIGGTSGAIAGRIAQKLTSGQDRGVENVAVRLDGGDIAITGPLGDFGFGRLKPGPHSLEVLDASLPADLQLVDRKRTVATQAGVTSRADFFSAALGSISGKLVASAAGRDVPDGPIANAYVVANPGERAVISNEDGTYTIDNLPAGTYTLAVDADSLPPDTDANDGARTVEVHSGERIEGVLFTIGEKLRAIDFTFSAGSKETPLSLSLAARKLPPGGVTGVTARVSANVAEVTLRAFGNTVALIKTGKQNIYSGRLVVPFDAKPGVVNVIASIGGAHPTTASATVEVDKSLPLVRVDIDPRRPAIGQYVRVRAGFIADVSPGDVITWQDGTTTKIPVFTGLRIATFTVKVSAVPFHGIIRTKTLPIPITIGM